ncbi:hypothetical protein ACJX0J_027729, partial [Zea mays]
PFRWLMLQSATFPYWSGLVNIHMKPVAATVYYSCHTMFGRSLKNYLAVMILSSSLHSLLIPTLIELLVDITCIVEIINNTLFL